MGGARVVPGSGRLPVKRRSVAQASGQPRYSLAGARSKPEPRPRQWTAWRTGLTAPQPGWGDLDSALRRDLRSAGAGARPSPRSATQIDSELPKPRATWVTTWPLPGTLNRGHQAKPTADEGPTRWARQNTNSRAHALSIPTPLRLQGNEQRSLRPSSRRMPTSHHVPVR